MNSLKVAVIHSYHREQTTERMHGAWSYPVPEFTWQRTKVSDGYVIDRADYAEYDFVLIEDSHALGTIVGEGVPVVYWVGDSIMSDWHYGIRHTQAQGADLILLTQDRLERFTDIGKPVRRWMMCIDENLFHPGYGDKTTDVGYFFAGTTKRRYYDWKLSGLCDRKGYRYQSGWRDGTKYPKSFARSRISVNVSYNPDNFSYRILQALACGTCLLTTPVPELDPDVAKIYATFKNVKELNLFVINFLKSGMWRDLGQRGYELVQKHHTWTKRATQLRQILSEELGI